MNERDRALVAAMAEVAEGLTRLVSSAGRAGGLDAAGSFILREYGTGAARVAAAMVGRAEELDGKPAALPPAVVDSGTTQ